MKKVFRLIILSGVFILFFSIFFFNSKGDIILNEEKMEKVKIAVCPTYYGMIKEMNKEKYQIISTGSTAESLSYLRRGSVDYALAGRTLKPGEKEFNFEFLDNGYSFLSSEGKVIQEEKLKEEPIFTDIPIRELVNVFNLDKVQIVDNVYNYLNKGIIVTGWKNTDYALAKLIHVVDKDGNRNLNSRIPTVYCSGECNEEIVNQLKNNIKKN